MSLNQPHIPSQHTNTSVITSGSVPLPRGPLRGGNALLRRNIYRRTNKLAEMASAGIEQFIEGSDDYALLCLSKRRALRAGLKLLFLAFSKNALSLISMSIKHIAA